MGKRTFVSLHDKPVVIELGNNGTFKMKPRDPVSGYSTLTIEDKITQWVQGKDKHGALIVKRVQPCVTVIVTDLGEHRNMPEPVLADDIASEFNRTQGDLIRCGVFVAEGQEPTEAELREARKKRHEWQINLIREADGVWAGANKNPMHINTNAHSACAELGIAKEWAVGAGTNVTKRCPKCAEVIQAQATRCRHCSYDLEDGHKAQVPAQQNFQQQGRQQKL